MYIFVCTDWKQKQLRLVLLQNMVSRALVFQAPNRREALCGAQLLEVFHKWFVYPEANTHIHNQRKFRSSNFRLYWKLPVALAASMFDSRDVSAGRNCAKRCVFSIVSWLRRFAKVGPKNGSCGGSAAQDVDKICTTPARESDLEVKIVKNWHVRSTFGSWHRQNLHHACARERFGSQNR